MATKTTTLYIIMGIDTDSGVTRTYGVFNNLNLLQDATYIIFESQGYPMDSIYKMWSKLFDYGGVEIAPNEYLLLIQGPLINTKDKLEYMQSHPTRYNDAIQRIKQQHLSKLHM